MVERAQTYRRQRISKTEKETPKTKEQVFSTKTFQHTLSINMQQHGTNYD